MTDPHERVEAEMSICRACEHEVETAQLHNGICDKCHQMFYENGFYPNLDDQVVDHHRV
jgi:hypothetical protein